VRALTTWACAAGCGLDGLEWKIVRGMLADCFAGAGIAITVYSI
jgi:hypothetical protein